jgi:hypothetical protein
MAASLALKVRIAASRYYPPIDGARFVIMSAVRGPSAFLGMLLAPSTVVNMPVEFTTALPDPRPAR